MLIAFIIAVAIIILDQVTKVLIYGMSESIIGDFLWFESTLNTGASFGMMKNGTVFFIIVTIPMIALMIWLICSKKFMQSKFFKASLGVVLGGTIGNLIDRIFIGGVRDFIYFKSINFAIFNVADIAITVGVVMLIVYLLIQCFVPEKDKKTEKQKEKLLDHNNDGDVEKTQNNNKNNEK